ncbi:DUF5357 family protein [Phormidium sp. CLA17]|uniref:DUF5357 family protein n=1 Tax=Leptolyngbya sp. Cla-17 TaxID=2803751 RepID=UPI0014924881|nr:DUF5357 family protein [Leptolyngbya sp. Cla-17]MBM0740513.1 DUF5357 family protein [Leptolyngbya sp. Cla-17]
MLDFLGQFISLFPPALIPLVILAIILLFAAPLGYFAFNFLAIQKLFEELSKIFQDIFKLIIPKKWDSAKTLIWLSVFSWVMSLPTRSYVQNFIAFCGWLFLIPGIHWLMYEEKKIKESLTIEKIFFAPWITGALICFFLFATPEDLPAIMVVSWPIISAIIAASPKFIKSGPAFQVPKPSVRQDLIIMVLFNLLLSCWIQLCYSTQVWLAQYPSVQADSLTNSSFVVKTQSTEIADFQGFDILMQAETELKESLQGQSWSQVERWLLNFDDRIRDLNEQIIDRLPAKAENAYWQVEGRVLAGEYNVELFAVWKGPSSNNLGYHLARTCQIVQVGPTDSGITSPVGSIALNTAQVGTAKVSCDSITGPTQGQPNMAK